MLLAIYVAGVKAFPGVEEVVYQRFSKFGPIEYCMNPPINFFFDAFHFIF